LVLAADERGMAARVRAPVRGLALYMLTSLAVNVAISHNEYYTGVVRSAAT